MELAPPGGVRSPPWQSDSILHPSVTTRFLVETAGGFQARLRERRAAVLGFGWQLNADVMAEVVFELVHLALNPDTELDDALVESFAATRG